MASSRCGCSIRWRTGRVILTTRSIGSWVTSKLVRPGSGVRVKTWAMLFGPGGKGGGGGRVCISAPRRILFVLSRPSVGSVGWGRLFLPSSNISRRVWVMRSRYCLIRPASGPFSFLFSVSAKSLNDTGSY